MEAESSQSEDIKTHFVQPSSSSKLMDIAEFSRHKDTVICCSIDSRNKLAVSGGIEETAFVWDLNTRHVIFEILGHKDTVLAASFSMNSTYIATGDMKGYIQVRNTTTGIKVFEYEIDEINWIQWHNNSEFVLLAGTTAGDFWMWNVNDPAAVKTFTSCGSSCTVGRLLSDGLRIVVGYANGDVRLFDLKTREAIKEIYNNCNEEITCLDINPTETLVAVGDLSSMVKLITVAQMKTIGTMYCKKMFIDPMDEEDQGEEPRPPGAEGVEVIDEFSAATNMGEQTEGPRDNHGNDVDRGEVEDEDDWSDDLSSNSSKYNPRFPIESVLFSPCGNFVAAANNSGTIAIWDVSTQAKRCEIQTDSGMSRCAWTSDGRYIAGCFDGRVRIYDINLNTLACIDAHEDQILDLVIRDNILVTASEDKTCKVIRL